MVAAPCPTQYSLELLQIIWSMMWVVPKIIKLLDLELGHNCTSSILYWGGGEGKGDTSILENHVASFQKNFPNHLTHEGVEHSPL